MQRKIVEHVSDEILKRDLDKYRKSAIELGAADAKIITTDAIVIDERVRAKCMYPRCNVYGAHANCPPYVPDIELIRKIVNNFNYAIFFKLDAPPETLVEGDIGFKQRNLEITSKIESQAYYDGYYLALGFGGASCKSTLCLDDECCALTLGQSCRHPLKARVTMHGVGMDVYKMATQAGWDIYPVGKSTQPSELPCISYLGLILIY